MLCFDFSLYVCDLMDEHNLTKSYDAHNAKIILIYPSHSNKWTQVEHVNSTTSVTSLNRASQRTNQSKKMDL